MLEYLSGGSLAEVVSICKMSEPQIAAVCKEVLKALKYIHSLKRIHRGQNSSIYLLNFHWLLLTDIKSDNILMGKGGEVKLGQYTFIWTFNLLKLHWKFVEISLKFHQLILDTVHNSPKVSQRDTLLWELLTGNSEYGWFSANATCRMAPELIRVKSDE